MQCDTVTMPLQDFSPNWFERAKVHHLLEQRNEWTDWNGSTEVTRRRTGLVRYYFGSVQQVVERRRTRGTRYLIKSVPALAFGGEGVAFLVGESISDCPLGGLLENSSLKNFSALRWDEIVYSVTEYVLRRESGFVRKLENIEREDIIFAGNEYPTYISCSKGPQKSLQWKKQSGYLSDHGIKSFLSAVEQRQREGGARI